MQGAVADDCMEAEGTTPRMEEVESRLEQRSRAMQVQLPRIKIFRSLLLYKQIPFKIPVKINHIQVAG
jgi:hypothetical protein